MKSYTDIEQSRKLAEILPLETADMCYINGDIGKISIGGWKNNAHDEDDVPCWSLAALLSIIPHSSLKKVLLGWQCISYDEDGHNCFLGEYTDNPVDACYEMILKLKELNLLQL